MASPISEKVEYQPLADGETVIPASEGKESAQSSIQGIWHRTSV